MHFGGGIVGVLCVPLFSKDFGIVYFWDRASCLVSMLQVMLALQVKPAFGKIGIYKFKVVLRLRKKKDIYCDLLFSLVSQFLYLAKT